MNRALHLCIMTMHASYFVNIDGVKIIDDVAELLPLEGSKSDVRMDGLSSQELINYCEIFISRMFDKVSIMILKWQYHSALIFDGDSYV